MKNNIPSILFLLSFLLWQCQNAGDPSRLRPLTPEEVVERARNRQPLSPYVVFKDSAGNPLDEAGKEKINAGVWATDQYVNAEGEVVELVARPAKLSDEVLGILVDEAYRSPPRIMPEPVDCVNKRAILREMLSRDQAVERAVLRTDLNRTYEADFENQNTLANLIDQCGFPTKKQVGEVGMEAVFRVLLHANSRFVATYYLHLQRSAEEGDFPRRYLAEITDYLLALHGREQVYGTQIRFNPVAGQNELYNLRQPETVDQRRNSVGLGPLKDFLAEWEVTWE